MIRVAVVDDHVVVRGGVSRILERTPDLALAAEGSSGSDALRLARERAFDVLVLDLDMPGGGLTLIGKVIETFPDARVLVFSQHDERDYALRCIEAGAMGYLSKDSGVEVIETAVRRIASGRRYLSEAAQELALDRVAGREGGAPHLRLTSRELEVVRMLARGQRSTDIAIELGISIKTVSTHRTRALEKLGVANTVELALYAREHGLV